MAGERFRRGNLQATLTLEPQESTQPLRVDPAALSAAVRIAKEIADETGLAPARVDGILALKGVIVQDEAVALDAAGRAMRDAAILESLAYAFDALSKARSTEGAKLAHVLQGQVRDIANLTEEAGRLASAQPAALRERLEAQLKDLVGAMSFTEDRIAQEVALLAAKADVREELDRLKSHAQDARQLIASGDGVGRKLDFLAQELNREANTLCAKSSDVVLTRVGLALKAAIDQFREQAQNVE
jgi:uncharacterized protein (TIGR00255 family)